VISRGCGRVYRSVHRAAACVVLACASASGAVAVAHAQASPAIVSHVAAGLIAETRNVVPGRPLQVALRQKIESGWHTYWSNPGESGLPTTIDWSLPSDFRAGPIVWPTPERFTVGPVVGYGYKGEVLLPITIDMPNGLQPGSDVTISAHASWLVCSDICIPEEADFSLSFPVGSAPEPDLDAAQAFATARTRTPTPNPFPTVATHSKDDIILRVGTGVRLGYGTSRSFRRMPTSSTTAPPHRSLQIPKASC
jgi:DsbC/DsbD-like thiol-disulfide interchange protein